MKNNQNLIKKLTELASETSCSGKLLSAMAEALGIEELKSIITSLHDSGKHHLWTYNYLESICDEISNRDNFKKQLHDKTYRRNETVSVLLSWFSDKKSGRVIEARKKLHERFLYLSYDEQIITIKAMLNSGKTDREWCYNTLRKWWSDDLQDDILKVWKTFQEERCGWLIAKYFPIEILKEEEGNLAYDSNYYQLCKRLVGEIDFSVDKQRLRKLINDSKYMWIMSQTTEGISIEESMNIVFNAIAASIYFANHDRVPENSIADVRCMEYIRKLSTWNIDENFYMVTLAGMDKMLSSMCRMGMWDDVLQFLKFDQNVHDTFITIYEKEINEIKDSEQYVQKFALESLYETFAQYYAKQFPACYRKALNYWRIDTLNSKECTISKTPTQDILLNNKPETMSREDFEILKQNNPILNDLVNKMGLEIQDDASDEPPF